MQAKTDEATMEDHEEIAEWSEVEAEAEICKGDSYMCSHYERDTCLIHFKCCTEDFWFACHKCHNEALRLVENLDEKGPENEEPAIDHSGDNYTRATNTSEEMEDSSNQAEISSEPEGLHNDASTGDKVERNETVTGETPRKPSNTVEGGSEENTSVNETGLLDVQSTSEKAERNMDGTSHQTINDEEGSSEEDNAINETGLHDDPSTSEKVERNMDGTSHEPSNDEEGSSEEDNAVNETGLHDDPSTSEEVVTNKTAAYGASDEQSNNEEGSSEENASQVPLDAVSPYPKKSKTRHSVATALDGTRLKCKHCGKKQEFSQYCVSCGKSFATYFCGKCKLLIEKNVDPYHCDDCGICRGNKADHFHCDVCNICMALSLKENHKCFADRGHDPCAICYEEVFSGAIIFPCHHMIHEDCAEKLLLSGSDLCPMCRSVIFQEDEEAVIVEETAQQTFSSEETFNSVFCLIGRKISGAAISLYKRGKRYLRTTGSSEREIEMANVSNTRNATVRN